MESALTIDEDFERRCGGPYSRNWTYYPDRDYSKIADHPMITGEMRILFIGGIGNTFEEHKENVIHLSKLAGDMPIHSIYNASHKIVNDLIEARMGLNLKATTPAILAYKNKLDFFTNSSNKSVCLEIDSSQGSIIGMNSQLLLPKKYRNRTVQLSLAPGAFSPLDLWKQSFNYCSSRDPIPKLQKVVGIIPPATRNITYLQPEKGDGIGHSFKSKMFIPIIEQHASEYFEGLYD